MKERLEGRRRCVLVVGSAGLRERVAQAGLECCDVLHAGTVAEARRNLAAHPELALVLLEAAEADPALVPTLMPEFPGLRVLLVTTDRALAEQATALAPDGAPAIVSADASPGALAGAVEQSLRRLEAYGAGSAPATTGAAGRGGEVRDAGGVWPVRPPSERIDLREEWLPVVAHDLRTPLGINIGYAALLLDEREYALPQTARELVQHMRANGEWMLELVDGILDLASLRATSTRLRYERVTPGEIVDAVAERMRGLADPKGVRITHTRRRNARTYALDRTRVEQVLHNLVANAIKFSHPGGTVHLGARASGPRPTFSVRDSGPGMTHEEAAAAFTKFAAAGRGHGLGLAIAKAIVELHGGRISMRTQPGRGARFSFTVTPGSDGP